MFRLQNGTAAFPTGVTTLLVLPSRFEEKLLTLLLVVPKTGLQSQKDYATGTRSEQHYSTETLIRPQISTVLLIVAFSGGPKRIYNVAPLAGRKCKDRKTVAMKTQRSFHFRPEWYDGPFRTAVSFWGQTT